MPKFDQLALSKGEVSPELAGRVDQTLYYTALKKARNVVVNQLGGASYRFGLRGIAGTKDHSTRCRLVEFVFGSTDTHLLEFGVGYIRVYREDALVTEAAQNITGVTQADPGVVTVVGHGLTTGDEVFVSGVGGMTEINNRHFTAEVLTANTFELRSQVDSSDNIDTTAYGTYTSGGTIAKIYEIETPFTLDELRLLKFSQSFDVLFMTVSTHQRYKLVRSGLANWALEAVTSQPDQNPPEDVQVTVNGATGPTTYKYAVTAVSDASNEESLTALSAGTSYTITNITQADPAVVTFSATPTGLETGNEIEISGVLGMTEVNDRRFRVLEKTATTFELQGIDSTDFTAYSSAGTAKPAFDFVTNGNATLSTTDNNTVSWAGVAGALRYVVYRERNGIFGLIGETQNTSFTDEGAEVPNVAEDAPFFRDPFATEGNWPTALGEHQQRTLYGGTDNAPAAFDASQVGAFDNFNRSLNIKQSDAFTATIDGRSNAQIRHFVSLTNLIVLTNASIKMVATGDNPFAFDTLSINGQEKFGASHLRPLVVGQRVLFEQENGERIHAGRFEFTADGVVLQDISLLSKHFLKDDRILEWAYNPFPDPIVYAVTEKGKVLTLTYNPEEQAQVTGWTQWDTQGSFESAASIRPVANERAQATYFVIKRTIDGKTVRYVEKYEPQIITDVRDAFHVDLGATFEDSRDIESFTKANPTVVTSTAHGWTDGDFIDIDEVLWQGTIDEKGTLQVPDDLNGRRYTIENSTANTFELRKIDGDLGLVDGTDFADYLGEGKARRAVTSISGLHQLPSTAVIALLNGNVHRNLQINSEGELELPERASRAHLGLQYIGEMQTLPANNPASRTESVLGEQKSVASVSFQVLESRGMLFGPDEQGLTEWAQRSDEKVGEATSLRTGVVRVTIDRDWNLDGSVLARMVDPLPAHVLRIGVEAEVA